MGVGRATRAPGQSHVDGTKQCACRHPAEHPSAPYHVHPPHGARSFVPEPGYCPVRLGMTTGRLQSGVNTLQGFKEDKRNKVTPGKASCFSPQLKQQGEGREA